MTDTQRTPLALYDPNSPLVTRTALGLDNEFIEICEGFFVCKQCFINCCGWVFDSFLFDANILSAEFQSTFTLVTDDSSSKSSGRLEATRLL